MQHSPHLLDAPRQAVVLAFRPTITDRQHAYLLRWLQAGRRMGLHDGQISITSNAGELRTLQAVIWVRENADPAYTVTPGRTGWTVVDLVRNHRLGEFPKFRGGTGFHSAGAWAGKRSLAHVSKYFFFKKRTKNFYFSIPRRNKHSINNQKFSVSFFQKRKTSFNSHTPPDDPAATRMPSERCPPGPHGAGPSRFPAEFSPMRRRAALDRRGAVRRWYAAPAVR